MTKVAGVALAAVMACGLAGEAQAIVVDTTWIASGDALQLGGLSYFFHYDGYKATLTMQSYYNSCYEEEYDCSNRYEITTKAVAEGIAKLDFSKTVNGTFFVDEYDISFTDPRIDRLTSDSRYGDSHDYFSGTYNLSVVIYSEGHDPVLINNNFPVDTFSISNVPVPASAPMFGAALLGLVGVGFAAKWRRAAA